ncbi:MAG: adenine phosphoribosyltransferase [Sandaracinus sp.]
MKLETFIHDVPDFPKPGIVFKDITPLLASPEAYRAAIDGLAEHARALGAERIVGIESRGFLFGAPLATKLGLPFVPVRKPGKLPRRSLRESYALEYGTDALEMHEDALPAGARTVIVDDVLATGGTAAAVDALVRRAGAEPVGALFLIELAFLAGVSKLGAVPARALVRYGA